jgi:hypothetical protein
MSSIKYNSSSSDTPGLSRNLRATDISTDTGSIGVGLRAPEIAVSAAVSAAGLTWEESGDCLGRADSSSIGPAAETVADTVSSDARNPALIL